MLVTPKSYFIEVMTYPSHGGLDKRSKFEIQYIIIEIHIVLNLFKWIYPKSKLMFLNFQSNPPNRILIESFFFNFENSNPNPLN